MIYFLVLLAISTSSLVSLACFNIFYITLTLYITYRHSNKDIPITDQRNLSLEVPLHQEHRFQDQHRLRSILRPVLQDLQPQQDRVTNRVDHKVQDFLLLQHPALSLSKDPQGLLPLDQDQARQNLSNHQEHI